MYDNCGNIFEYFDGIWTKYYQKIHINIDNYNQFCKNIDYSYEHLLSIKNTNDKFTNNKTNRGNNNNTNRGSNNSGNNNNTNRGRFPNINNNIVKSAKNGVLDQNS